ncbi:unnamed protein product [Tuber melanosporum]|uniref:Kinesin-like protein KIF22 n=1 Tax=Tuber melanosporum (strain Mel28) TaxID=656061 RepID=D5GDT6_TUBMM|nr:uncharacterized protein GSTUM_00006264001 [Tuber melanosporum]CAZ82679.1 unnamed protein product [Tuber melanosporum]
MTVNNVRIIARIRPLLKGESEKDVVVSAEEDAISMPNPKNENENFTFPFNAAYGQDSDQAQLFSEVSPTLKHLFKGNDVTIFAYGATGSGKTYTMRGQKPASERGIIPRFLTAIYRRGKELERKTEGATTIRAIMTYYEIYNDRVFDLFQPPEKRTPAGLPLRESNGKTQVVGLIDKEIKSLKEFEALYDKANANRSTSATKLNAHSSRSHAVICVKVLIEDKNTGENKTGTVSCIDLAGSEDNRRTSNDKERMTESASINKSLFVLAQCVEAMTKKQSRIPYRESKMTRILSLGQNNGLTVMILNLAPTRAFHLDTLSSLNFANRTKKVELKQAENEHPQGNRSRTARYRMEILKSLVSFPSRHDQLPPMLSQHGPTRAFGTAKTNTMHVSNPQKGFQKDKAPKPQNRAPLAPQPLRQPSGIKKPVRSYDKHHQLSPTNIADIVEKKVEEILAARALNEPRLELLEKKLEKKADAKAEGLTYILLAKQHAARGENFSALKMYELAVPYFPENDKLLRKISDLKDKDKKTTTIRTTMRSSSDLTSSLDTTNGKPSSYSSIRRVSVTEETFAQAPAPMPRSKPKRTFAVFSDNNNDVQQQPVPRSLPAIKMEEDTASEYEDDRSEEEWSLNTHQTPRTKNLLRIINSEDVSQIMKLKGVGKKRAEALAQVVRERRRAVMMDDDDDFPAIKDLEELGMIKGIGQNMVENMRSGLSAAS